MDPSAVAAAPAHSAASPPANHKEVKPMKVGDYELSHVIGQGAHSTVRSCIHLPTKSLWVAKVISKSHSGVDQVVRAEIATLRKVSHVHIVMLREILESPRNFYIILEAVTGGDMCDKIMAHQTGLPEPIAARYFSQIVAGLLACHRQGVAHRDLKPENLLITVDDQVKISDFGLSRVHRESRGRAQPQEYARTLTGTLNYAAPEVLEGTEYDAFLADLWSLGCLLFAMLCGRFPFGSATNDELRGRIARMEISALPPSVSPEARDLVARLLRYQPTQRISLEEAAQHPFVLGGYAANSEDAPPPNDTSSWNENAAPQVGIEAVSAEDEASSPKRGGGGTAGVAATSQQPLTGMM